MLTEIFRHVKNYFPGEAKCGDFVICGGILSPCDFLQEGEYYRISGSVKNDGVHIHPATDLEDESFCGEILKMRPPKAFLRLAEEIMEYCRTQESRPSPYLKESFGGYSYTRFSSSDGGALPWQRAFKTRLNDWRKL